MRYISLFSGIEAASVAWEPLGWEAVAFCEIARFPSAVLSYRYPNVPNLGDITKVDWYGFKERYGSVDIIVGGSPCQSFSIAGGRASLQGESALCFEYWRAVRDLRPTWFLWENVPGVFSTRDNAFGQFLGKMEELGYGMAWRTLDAQFFGVAQRRRRVFLVGYLGNVGAAAAVLFESESVRGNTKSSKEKRKEIAASHGRCARSIVCMSDDQMNSAIDNDMVGTLKVGGAEPTVFINSTGEEITGALCARDAFAPSNQYVEQGKIICELNPGYTNTRGNFEKLLHAED